MTRLIGLPLLIAAAAGCASAPAPPRPAPPPSAPAAASPAEHAAAEPAPVPTLEAAPPGPAPARPGTADDGPPIRVLLRRTAGTVVLPQPGRAYLAEAGGRSTWLFGPLELAAASEREWQVGAWSDPATAAVVARRLEDRLGAAARVRREPTPSGLTRVRVRWAAGEPADPEAALAAIGFPGAMAVAAGGSVRVAGRGGGVVAGDEVRLTPDGDWPTAVGERRYRGRFRARLGGGELLVINDLGMEAYLRGVVPVEMGPYVFPELAALEAQAVAARTYAVAHLGDHDDEGWDICDTPACQAYHGADAEHPLTDRAVAETRGLIATWAGEPIDAMYTSTCGGRTEDAAELFGDRAQPYLKGVACAWERPLVLVGEPDVGDVGDEGGLRRLLARRVLAPAGGPADPAALLPLIAARCGGDPAAPPTQAGPDGWAEALLGAAGLGATGPLAAGSGVDRLLRLADLFDVPLPPPPAEGWDGGWHLEAAAAVLELQGVIRVDRGEAVPRPDGVGFYPRRGDGSETLPTPLPLLWRWGGRVAGAAELRVRPGTALERYRAGDRVLALVVVRSGGDAEADRRSAWRSWSRDRSWSELEAGLGVADLERLEITERGRSGRVVGLRAVGRDGRGRLVEGFEVRRALDLPETLFEMSERRLPDGTRSVRFLGRGWGHGVGMCQNGAYGLARAGMTFDQILAHYYTGVAVEPWNPR